MESSGKEPNKVAPTSVIRHQPLAIQKRVTFVADKEFQTREGAVIHVLEAFVGLANSRWTLQKITDHRRSRGGQKDSTETRTRPSPWCWAFAGMAEARFVHGEHPRASRIDSSHAGIGKKKSTACIRMLADFFIVLYIR